MFTLLVGAAQGLAVSCSDLYGQCGGKTWNGPTCCSVGVCQPNGEYYSQCVPDGTPSNTPGSPSNSPTTTSAVPQPTVYPKGVNPYVGAKGFINPEYVASVDLSISKEPSIKDAAEKVKQFSSAIWIDTMKNLERIPVNMKLAAKQASADAPVVIQFVVYDLPGRDCNALASNGEIPTGGLATYKADYIDKFAKLLADNADPNVRVVLIIEPDSLPNLATNLNNPRCAAAQDDYYSGVAYALAKLTMPNVFMYIDCAHGGWLGWPDNRQKIGPIFTKAIDLAKTLNPKVQVNGFATSTANISPFNANGTAPATDGQLQLQNGEYVFQGNPCIDENLYTSKLAPLFFQQGLPTRFIVDTGRSGQAGIRKHWGSWCNIKGMGIGERPRADPAPLIDAFVWIKPPGESDGISGPQGVPRLDGFCDPTTYNGADSMDGAPQAGEWFHEQFVMLVKKANPPL
ncbi:cellobiohydrolaseII [Gorgonomyces haynaldii]|nr:cellobiohydrolaseII [Gorgonomyces haynaldii]